MKKDKILLLLTRFPYPTTDGTRYKILENVARGLQKDFDIEFFIVTQESWTQEQIEYLEKNFGRVHVFSISWATLFFRMMLALCSRLPLQTYAFVSPKAKAWIATHAFEYKSMYVHTTRMTEYVRLLPQKIRDRIVVDLNDALSLNYQEAKKNTKIPWWRIYYSIEASRIARYEQLVLGAFKHINVITKRDQQYLLQGRGIPQGLDFVSIPHGVSDELLNYVSRYENNELVFIGNLEYAPNSDAVNFFIDQLWPQVKTKIPDARLLIIGKGGEKYTPAVGVEFSGFLDDPYARMLQSKISIAPIRFGAGMPSKIIEAMAIGLPVITTEVGAVGIDGLIHGENIFIISQSDINAWVETITSLLSDSNTRNHIVQNAKKLVQERYTNSVVQESFRALFNRAIR